MVTNLSIAKVNCPLLRYGQYCNWSLTQSPLILNLTRNKDLALGLRVVANELVVSGGREEKSGGALVDGEQWPLS